MVNNEDMLEYLLLHVLDAQVVQVCVILFPLTTHSLEHIDLVRQV